MLFTEMTEEQLSRYLCKKHEECGELNAVNGICDYVTVIYRCGKLITLCHDAHVGVYSYKTVCGDAGEKETATQEISSGMFWDIIEGDLYPMGVE